jgi:hypothetical protein
MKHVAHHSVSPLPLFQGGISGIAHYTLDAFGELDGIVERSLQCFLGSRELWCGIPRQVKLGIVPLVRIPSASPAVVRATYQTATRWISCIVTDTTVATTKTMNHIFRSWSTLVYLVATR